MDIGGANGLTPNPEGASEWREVFDVSFVFGWWLDCVSFLDLFLLFWFLQLSALIFCSVSRISITSPDLYLTGSGGVSSTITELSRLSFRFLPFTGFGVLSLFCVECLGIAPFSGVCWTTWIRFSRHDACCPWLEQAQLVVERLSGSTCVSVRAQLLMKSWKDLMLLSDIVPWMSLAQKWFGMCDENKRRQLRHWNSAR